MNYCYSLLILLSVSMSYGQDFHFVKFVSEDVEIIHEYESTTVTLLFEILDGYHIQLEKVEDENLLATKINFDNQLQILNTEFTCMHFESVILDKKALQVLSHSFEVKVKLKSKNNSDFNILKGNLFYQTCDDFKCYFPRELDFAVSINK